ncbi:hypothetical protein ASC58_12460 [Phycicoccus sp. Root101]|nr:hypothetical protein ASC58_12460 [Phycicoccus sp. Root101]
MSPATPAPDLSSTTPAQEVQRPSRVGLLGLLIPCFVSVAALVVVGAIPQSFPGLPDPGVATRFGLPVVRGLRDSSAAITIGMLVMAAIVLPPAKPDGKDRIEGIRALALRFAGVFGSVWAVASVLMLALTYSDLAGVPVATSSTWLGIHSFVTDFDLGKSLAVSAALVIVAAGLAASAQRIVTAGWALVVGIGALLPLALTGHAAGAANHSLAVDAQAAHLVGVTIWVGGLTALLLLRKHLGSALTTSVKRFSALAGWAYLMVAVSGVGAALARLDSLDAVRSPYGALLAAKALLFTGLGAAGWAHRRWLLPQLSGVDGARRFTRLVLGEAIVMSMAIGLAAALSATSPPAVGSSGQESTAESLLGYPMPPALGTGLHWLTQWRLDSIWVPVSVAGLGWYLLAVRRLKARGDTWPVGRTVAWAAGCIVMIVATSASPGVYGRVLFSVHMVQHMTIAMTVPVLLVFGAPVTLAVRTLSSRADGSRGPREWLLAIVHSRPLAVLGHPLVAAGNFVASMVAFYYSPLLDLALRTHTGHVLMTLHFLLSGYLLASALVGVDPGPARPPYVFRLLLLMATFGFHALFAVALMSSSTILAQDWFGTLGRPWGNSLAKEQYLGGALGWAIGDYPVAMMAVAMAVGWIRSDKREARRYDRQATRDGDAALAAYNEHLRQLHARHAGPLTTRTAKRERANQGADTVPREEPQSDA